MAGNPAYRVQDGRGKSDSRFLRGPRGAGLHPQRVDAHAESVTRRRALDRTIAGLEDTHTMRFSSRTTG